MSKSTKIAEFLLAREGKTLAEVAPYSSLGRIVRRNGVRADPEFERIKALPRRKWEEDPNTERLVELLTATYKTSSGTMRLKPVQAVALAELHDLRGCMGVARVGSGKTLISALAPVVLEAKRPLYLGPAKLMKKTERDFRKLADHWQVCRTYEYLSYEKLSNVKYYSGILEKLAPDFICFEEGHHLKNRGNNRYKVLRDYLKAHPTTICLNLTGTWARNAVKEGAHVAEWCLGEGTPFPRSHSAMDELAAAVDKDVTNRLAPGVLVDMFCNGRANNLEDVQAGYGRRVTETPGFVTVQGSDCDATLCIEGEPFNNYPATVEAYFDKLRNDFEAPGGETFIEPSLLWSYMRQCQTGFYYYYDPAPPEEWRQCRRAWGAFVRDILKYNRKGLIAGFQVANACASGLVESHGLYQRWKEIEPTYDPEKHKKTAWFGDTAMEHCAAWLEKWKGVVFTPYVAVGEKLEEMTGIPYFGRGGMHKTAGFIEEYRGPAVASLQANFEGRNLQHYRKAMIVGGVKSGSRMEQLLGRLHRSGQEADEVDYEIFYGCIEAIEEIWSARDDAKWGRNMNQDEAHKLLVADILLPTLEDAEQFVGARWQKAS